MSKQNAKFWDKHFEVTDLKYPNEAVVRFLAKNKTGGGNTPLNKVLLDWGCATGRHTLTALEMGYEVIAADFVKNCIELTKNKVAKAGFKAKFIVNKDSNNIEQIADESLDLILIWGLFMNQDLQGIKTMLANSYRMLKNGGKIFCDFRSVNDSLFSHLQKVGDKTIVKDEFRKGGYKKDMVITILTLDEIKTLLNNAGFKIQNIEIMEFSEENMTIKNSWYQVTLIK